MLKENETHLFPSEPRCSSSLNIKALVVFQPCCFKARSILANPGREAGGSWLRFIDTRPKAAQ